MDIATLSVAAIFGFGRLPAWLRHHRNFTPVRLVIAGLLLNITGRFGSVYLGPYVTPSLLVAGAMVMAYGLWRDRQLCKLHESRPLSLSASIFGVSPSLVSYDRRMKIVVALDKFKGSLTAGARLRDCA